MTCDTCDSPEHFWKEYPNKGQGKGQPPVHMALYSKANEHVDLEFFYDTAGPLASTSYLLRARYADAAMAASGYVDDLHDALDDMGAVATPFEEWLGLADSSQGHLQGDDISDCEICDDDAERFAFHASCDCEDEARGHSPDPTVIGLSLEVLEDIGWGHSTATCFAASEDDDKKG